MAEHEHVSLEKRYVDAIRGRIESGAVVSPTRIREDILNAQTWSYGVNVTFASRKPANNKLDIERLALPQYRAVYSNLLVAMGCLVTKHEHEMLWGPPKGGQNIARHLGQILEVEVAELEMIGEDEQGFKQFGFVSTKERLKARRKKKIGIEDASNEFTTILSCLKLPEIRDGTTAIVNAWRRGEPGTEQPLPEGVVIEEVVHEPIPKIITPNHAFYQENAHRALVGSGA